MYIFFYALLFIFGLIAGSFISMLTYRLPRDLPILGRSFCDSCRKKIPWRYNIPLLGYLIQKGRCFRCRKKISIRYFLVELACGVLYPVTGYLWLIAGPSSLVFLFKESMPSFSSLVLLLLLVTCYLSLTVVDLEFQILPDEITFFLGVAVFMGLLFLPSPLLFQHVFWGLVGFSFFLAIFLLTGGRGLGFGDVKLSFVIASFLGYPQFLVWLFVSFLGGAFVGIVLLLFGKFGLKHEIAFGPFLLTGAFVTVFFGGNMFDWYTNLL